MFDFKESVSLREFWIVFGINLGVNLVFFNLVRYLNLPEILYILINVVTTFIMISVGYKRLENAGFSGFFFLIPVLNLILAMFPKKES